MFLGYRRLNNTWQSVDIKIGSRQNTRSSVQFASADDTQLDFKWLGGFPRSKGDYMAVSLFDNQQNGKLYNVEDSFTFNSFICEKVSRSHHLSVNP